MCALETKPKVVSVRLNSHQMGFIESVRGDLLPGEAVKNIIDYLSNFESVYTKNILRDIMRIKSG